MRYSFRAGILYPPASDDVLLPLKAVLPSSLFDFYRIHNGGEGYIEDEYIIIWPSNKIAEFNAGYEVERNADGLVLIGSDGGGDAYGFDLLGVGKPIVRVPFVGMSRSRSMIVANDIGGLFCNQNGDTQKKMPQQRDVEIVEITPILFGGDPIDRGNKAVITREQHLEYVRYWNRLLEGLR